MADNIDIEWVRALAESRSAIPASLNPISGCERATEACRHCYAAAIAYRFKGPWAGLAELDQHGVPRFNGTVRFAPEKLLVPLRAKKPRVYFVCDMADLFHPAVAEEWIDQVFAMMALTPRHHYLLLTKRPARMRAYLSDPKTHWRVACAAVDLLARGGDRWTEELVKRAVQLDREKWPLPNVWVGASVHDQKSADAFVPDLLAAPAALHYLSMEPLLGEVDLTRRMRVDDETEVQPLTGERFVWRYDDWRSDFFGPRIRWVITGGESGPGARPRHLDWVRPLRDQCANANVPFFEKQSGSWAARPWKLERLDDETDDAYKDRSEAEGATHAVNLDGHVVKLSHKPWSIERAATTPPGWQGIALVGKKKAGRLLDGVEHNEIPKVAA